MIKFATLNEDGTVHSLGAKAYLPDGTIEISGDLAGYASMMVVDGLWVPRPQISAPNILGGEVRFEGVPEGASCEILDRDFNYIAGQVNAVDGVIEFQISDAGTYQLEVSAPLPWLYKTLNVVIT